MNSPDKNLHSSHADELTYDIDDSYPMLMSTSVIGMREMLNEMFSSAGYSVTSEQWIILTFLADRDGVSQQDLAKRYDRSEVSVLNLLKKLEQQNLILRQRDPVDGRCNRVFLTVEGRKLHQQLIPLAKANMVRMSEGISAEELVQFKNTLRRIRQNLKA